MQFTAENIIDAKREVMHAQTASTLDSELMRRHEVVFRRVGIGVEVGQHDTEVAVIFALTAMDAERTLRRLRAGYGIEILGVEVPA